MNSNSEYEHIKREIEETTERLQKAQNVLRKKNGMQKDLRDVEGELAKLEIQMREEKMDVDRLKGLSLSNLYHTILNDKVEQLEKEESEVLAVKVKIDRLAYEKEQLIRSIEQLKAQANAVSDLENRLVGLKEKKKEALRSVQPEIWQKITVVEGEIEQIKLVQVEISEAYNAGINAQDKVSLIQGSLKSAANWGTYDMLGGGLIATMAKRGHLDDAQQQMHNFQHSLRDFNRELRDVGESVSFDIQIDQFMSFADWFFDGFFVDWAVQSRINDARNQMSQLEGRINTLMDGLKREKKNNIDRVNFLNNKIDTLVSEA